MKKQVSNFNQILKIVSVIAMLLLASFNMVAQGNIIKITPLQPLSGKFTATYEKVLNTNSSVLGNIELWFFDASRHSGLAFPAMYGFISGEPSPYYYSKGTRVSGEYRRYIFNKKSASGLYGGLNVFAGRHKVGLEKYENPNSLGMNRNEGKIAYGSTNLVAVGGGVKMGYQLRIGNFYLDANTMIGSSQVLGKDGISVEDDFLGRDVRPFERDVQGAFYNFNLAVGIGF